MASFFGPCDTESTLESIPARHKPLEIFSSIFRAMPLLVFSGIGLPLPSLKHLRISGPWNSGKTAKISASGFSNPLSTHCSTEMAVMSLVHEAIHTVTSRDMGAVEHVESGLTNCVPEHFEYIMPILITHQNLKRCYSRLPEDKLAIPSLSLATTSWHGAL